MNNDGVIQNQGQFFVGNSSNTNESQSIDINVINLNNHVANDCEHTSVLPTQQSSKTTQGPESKKKTKKSKRKSDSVLTDDKEDSIALRMKRNERRINQQSNGDDDENASYEY